MTLPKTLKKYESKISDYENDTAQDNGHWVYYAAGWKSYTDPMGCLHQDHEDTIKELATCARYALKCDCAECVEMLTKARVA